MASPRVSWWRNKKRSFIGFRRGRGVERGYQFQELVGQEGSKHFKAEWIQVQEEVTGFARRTWAYWGVGIC